MECLGGNGYVEESVLPRLFRESPVNAIWEGSGNVIALDVARAIAKDPDSVAVFLDALDTEDASIRATVDLIARSVESTLGDESLARRLTELLAIAWAGTLMRAHTPSDVADTYVRSRLDGDRGSLFGTLPAASPTAAIARRAVPAR
jgi:putative acyl-CoA dehydrogenase